MPAGTPDRTLRLIAVFKFAKAATLLGVATASFGLLGDRVRGVVVDELVHVLARVGEGSEFRSVHALAGPWLAQALAVAAHWLGAATPGRLAVTGAIALGYAALLGAEGFGLWTARPWAERVSVAVTASLVPFEVWELVRRVTVVRAAVLVLNVLVVWYLVRRMRGERRPGVAAIASG